MNEESSSQEFHYSWKLRSVADLGGRKYCTVPSFQQSRNKWVRDQFRSQFKPVAYPSSWKKNRLTKQNSDERLASIGLVFLGWHHCANTMDPVPTLTCSFKFAAQKESSIFLFVKQYYPLPVFILNLYESRRFCHIMSIINGLPCSKKFIPVYIFSIKDRIAFSISPSLWAKHYIFSGEDTERDVTKARALLRFPAAAFRFNAEG